MLDYGDAVADWFAGLGQVHADRGELEEALKYTDIAGSLLCRQSRNLTSLQVEANLRQVAGQLLAAGHIHWRKPREETCLHVASEVLPAGGLTSMIARWVANDASGRRHSMVVLNQETPKTPELLDAISNRGGKVFLADQTSSLVERARWLRKLAFENASHVVLHVDTSDVICGAAFGVPGGPPVMLVNHAAHIYWTGASIVDVVLNCRGSDLEGIWASKHRGIKCHATLPIPLPESSGITPGTDFGGKLKQQARASLGVSPDAVVLLTVGASFKYLATDDQDFVQACERVLEALPNGVVLAAGFVGDNRWQAACARTGNRIRTLGRLSQDQLATLRKAADIYLEGFPFGTTTSLLESAICGLPVILAPATCPPPYGSDGVALDKVLQRPQSVEEYVNRVIHLGSHPEVRQQEGTEIRNSVCKHHTGEGWRRYLEAVIRTLPAEHAVTPIVRVTPTPASVYEHWSRFLPRWTWSYEHTLENGLLHAYAHGLKPRLDRQILQSCGRAEDLRKGRTIPLPVLIALCNYLMVLLPAPAGRRLYRLFFSLCLGSLVGRCRRRLTQILGLADKPRGAYEEYRAANASRTWHGR